MRSLRVPLTVLLSAWMAYAQLSGSSSPHATTSIIGQGETRRHAIRVAGGAFVEVTLDPKGTLLSFEIRGPDGLLAQQRRLGGRLDRVRWCAVAAAPAELAVRVSSEESASGSRPYVLAWTTRSAIEGDVQRAAGCQAFQQAEQLRDSGMADARAAALGQFQEALLRWEAAGDPLRQAETLSQIGQLLWELGRTQDSLAAHQKALAQWRQGNDRRGEAGGLNLLGLALLSSGQPAQAAALFEQALAVAQQAGDKIAQADAQANQALVLSLKGENAKALQVAALALPLKQAAEDRKGEAYAYLVTGLIRHRMGAWDEAVADYLRCLEIRQGLRDRLGISDVHNNLGAIYGALGEIEKSVANYENALAIRQEFANPHAIAATQHNLAVALIAGGDYDRALNLLEQELATWRAVSGKRGQAYALLDMGNLYRRLGNLEAGLRRYGEALALFREQNDRHGEVRVLLQLAGARRALNEPRQALESYRQALRLSQTANLQAEAGRAFSGLAAALWDLGDFEAARAQLEEAIPWNRKVRNPSQLASDYTLLGKLHLRSGNAASSVSAFEEALQAARSQGERTVEEEALVSLSRAEAALGRLELARSHLLEALEHIELRRSTISSPELRATLLASVRQPYRQAVEVLLALHRQHPARGYAVEAFEVHERGLAWGTLQLLAASGVRAEQGVDPRLLDEKRRLDKRLSSKAEALTRLLAQPETRAQAEATRRQIEGLLDRHREIQAKLWRENPRYAALAHPRPLRASEIQGRLPRDGVLLEYTLGAPASYLWALTPDSVEVYQLPSQPEIERAAQAARTALEEPSRVAAGESLPARRQRLARAQKDFHLAARLLSQWLLAPVAQRIQGKHVWVVADGALQYLPFAALEPPVVETASWASLPAAGVLALLGPAQKPQVKRLAVFADPVFEAGDARVRTALNTSPRQPEDTVALRSAADFDLVQFPRLRFSRHEALELARLAGRERARVQLDFAADREMLLNWRLEDYDVLHFATHALLNERHPELSGIVLSLVDERGRPRNGFLRLHEIYNLKLKARLVTLSACRTAIGKRLEGEGLIGLARGFLHTGASGVLATLWALEDRATAVFMKMFYEALLKGQAPASALRAAQNRMRRHERWRDPYYWAGFVYQGL